MKIICENNSCSYWKNYHCTRKEISKDILALCNERINSDLEKIKGKYLAGAHLCGRPNQQLDE